MFNIIIVTSTLKATWGRANKYVCMYVSTVDTVEPRVNEEPTDWQNVFVISRLFFIYLVMSRVKKIVRETEDFVIPGFHQWPSTKVKSSRVSQACAIKKYSYMERSYEVFHYITPRNELFTGKEKRVVHSYIHFY